MHRKTAQIIKSRFPRMADICSLQYRHFRHLTFRGGGNARGLKEQSLRWRSGEPQAAAQFCAVVSAALGFGILHPFCRASL